MYEDIKSCSFRGIIEISEGDKEAQPSSLQTLGPTSVSQRSRFKKASFLSYLVQPGREEQEEAGSVWNGDPLFIF